MNLARHVFGQCVHGLGIFDQTCDHLIVIHEGKLVDAGSPAELAQKHGRADRVEVETGGGDSKLEAALSSLKSAKVIEHFDLSKGLAQRSRAQVTLGKGGPELLAKGLIENNLGLRMLRPLSNELESLFAELAKDAS